MRIKHIEPGESFRDPSIVRTEVFVSEQKFSPENEFDEIDKIANHVVIYNLEDEPVAAGRWFPTEGKKGEYTVGRVAVVKASRGLKLGALVMEAIEEKAREIGAASLYLGAQDHARGFYEKLGYKVSGDEYMDEHCPHYPMTKMLD